MSQISIAAVSVAVIGESVVTGYNPKKYTAARAGWGKRRPAR